MADSISVARPKFRWSRARKDWAVALLVGAMVSVAWASDQGFFGDQKFSDPISYRGDAYFSAAIVAAARRGDYFPFTSKLIPSLGAPFVANWNDFPGTDDMVFYLVGLLARLTDTIVAVNIGYMLACASAGMSMFLVARRYGFRREGGVLAGFLYGMAPYIFARTVHHYSLTFIGIMPWNVLVMSYLGSRRGLPFKSARFRIAAIATILTGWSFVYYIWFAVQLYVFGTLAGIMRNGRKVKMLPMLALAAIFAFAALSVSLDSIQNAIKNGTNAGAVARSPPEIELYALKPISLMVPSHMHRWPWWRQVWFHSRPQNLVSGEEPAPYQGIFGFVLLLGLGLTGMAQTVRKKGRPVILVFAATTAWLMIAHSAGGLSNILGLFNIILFRSNNRVSAMIAALGCLFGAWAIPKVLRGVAEPARWFVCIVLAIGARYENGGQVNPMESVAANRRQVENDRHLVASMEEKLPKGAMIFQLPAMHFPEVGPAYAVDTYELFRPYFFANTFRFSYGDVKGRPNADWKFKISGMAPPSMVSELKTAGFAAILLNRKGYPDGGAGLLQALVAAGCTVIVQSELGDNVALTLP